MSDGHVPFEGSHFTLTGKLGPLPVWAWGAIAGGAVLTFVYIRSRNSAKDAANVTATTTTQAVNPVTGDTTVTGAGVNTSAYTTDGLVGGSTSTGTQSTNTTWIAQAEANVASATGASPTLITQALQAFLMGTSITPAQQVYVDKAIATTGQPPEGTTGTVTTAPAYSQYQQQVVSLYQTLLGRTPSADELVNNAWASDLAAGIPASDVAKSIMQSPEYKNLHPGS